MNDLKHYKATFSRVGWFIPPYVTMEFISRLAKEVHFAKADFSQHELEQILALVYAPESLSAMATERYPITPYIQDFMIIISEAIEAHFLGLHHVAVSGLLPVVEGAARKLASSRQIEFVSIKSVFVNLATECKKEVVGKNIGAVGEVVSLLDSFIEFARDHLYGNSDDYPFGDRTNRHGILHGAFADADYGKPINFYKAISAVDALCFISALRAPISWFPPSPTDASRSRAAFYLECAQLAKRRPGPG